MRSKYEIEIGHTRTNSELNYRNVAPNAFSIMTAITLTFAFCAYSHAGEQARIDQRQTRSSIPSVVSTRRSATAEQWKQAVGMVFDKIDVTRLRDKENPAYVEALGESDSAGNTQFFACFDKSPPMCDLSASGKRDDFRKIQFFSDPGIDWWGLTTKYAGGSTGRSFVGAYVSLPDCRRPTIFLHPTFRGDGWMFVENFGIMADGAMIIDRKFESSYVDRDNFDDGISESIHVALSDREVKALRKLVQAQNVIIRIAGKREYIGIGDDEAKTFVMGIGRLLRIYDSLGLAINRLGPTRDRDCPALLNSGRSTIN